MTFSGCCFGSRVLICRIKFVVVIIIIMSQAITVSPPQTSWSDVNITTFYRVPSALATRNTYDGERAVHAKPLHSRADFYWLITYVSFREEVLTCTCCCDATWPIELPAFTVCYNVQRVLFVSTSAPGLYSLSPKFFSFSSDFLFFVLKTFISSQKYQTNADKIIKLKERQDTWHCTQALEMWHTLWVHSYYV